MTKKLSIAILEDVDNMEDFEGKDVVNTTEMMRI